MDCSPTAGGKLSNKRNRRIEDVLCPVMIQAALDLSDGVERIKVVEKAGYEANILSETQEGR